MHGSTLARGLRVVWMGVRQEPWWFAAAVLGSGLYGAGTAGGGWVLGRVTDAVLAPAFAAGRITGHQLFVATGSLALVGVLTALGVVARRVAAGITMFRLQARYRREVTRQYLRLPLSWHHRHPTGQLLSNANADVEAMWQVMAPLPMSLGVLVMLLVAAGAMVAADPVLAGVGLLVVPALLWVNTVYQRRMSPQVMRVQALRAEVSAVAHESFEGALVVKTLGREAEETRRFEADARALAAANVEVGRTRGVFDPVIEALPTLGTLAVLAVGTLRVGAGQARTGDVVQVAYLLTLIAFPVRSLGWVLGELPRTVVGWERVRAVLRAQGGLPYGEQSLPGGRSPATLAVRDAGYDHAGPEGEAVPALRGITLDVPAGSTLAVVGPTGSGKSTLADLLVRLVDPVEGAVLLDGVDLRALAAGQVPSAVALVPQGTFVFDDTVRGNVTLGAGLTDEQVWEALREARADRFVAALPGGLDTRVGERGTTLSGGQRQRLALARALVRHPRLLVLDDATSAVDPAVEAAILGGLRETGGAVTVVVIAYRMATIALADEVVYVEQGRVAGRGTHAELLSDCPGYRELVTAYARDAQARAAAPAGPDAGPSGEELPGEELPGEELPGDGLSGEELPGDGLSGEELPGEDLPGGEVAAEVRA
ncbi:MAG TPA: ABC transporter ATP-binding protein [Kineosporiaceae bacterium]|nr:ABC transporter ATP-binding protein [Kineosporiaceae bacterium]